MSGPEPPHLARLLARFPDARPSGKAWSSRCPAHDDRNPSLTIAMGTEKPDVVMVKCGAGCFWEDVLAAVGLSRADCGPEQTGRGAAELRRHSYADEDGLVRYQVRRYDRRSNKFAYWHPTPEGWTAGRGEGPKLPYRLPELLAEPGVPVMVCEGRARRRCPRRRRISASDDRGLRLVERRRSVSAR